MARTTPCSRPLAAREQARSLWFARWSPERTAAPARPGRLPTRPAGRAPGRSAGTQREMKRTVSKPFHGNGAPTDYGQCLLVDYAVGALPPSDGTAFLIKSRKIPVLWRPTHPYSLHVCYKRQQQCALKGGGSRRRDHVVSWLVYILCRSPHQDPGCARFPVWHGLSAGSRYSHESGPTSPEKYRYSSCTS